MIIPGTVKLHDTKLSKEDRLTLESILMGVDCTTDVHILLGGVSISISGIKGGKVFVATFDSHGELTWRVSPFHEEGHERDIRGEDVADFARAMSAELEVA